MPQRTQTDNQGRATEPEFYIPAGVSPSFIVSRFERLWATLFNHHVEPPK